MCTSTSSSQATLPAKLTAGRRARRFLTEHWCAPHSSADLDHALLLVTELVTNAVNHGGPPITVELECMGPDGVVIAVSDGSDDLPDPQTVTPQAVGGRGVHLVDLLSAEWGIDYPDHRTGDRRGGQRTAAVTAKTVWCRLTPAGVF